MHRRAARACERWQVGRSMHPAQVGEERLFRAFRLLGQMLGQGNEHCRLEVRVSQYFTDEAPELKLQECALICWSRRNRCRPGCCMRGRARATLAAGHCGKLEDFHWSCLSCGWWVSLVLQQVCRLVVRHSRVTLDRVGARESAWPLFRGDAIGSWVGRYCSGAVFHGEGLEPLWGRFQALPAVGLSLPPCGVVAPNVR